MKGEAKAPYTCALPPARDVMFVFVVRLACGTDEQGRMVILKERKYICRPTTNEAVTQNCSLKMQPGYLHHPIVASCSVAHNYNAMSSWMLQLFSSFLIECIRKVLIYDNLIKLCQNIRPKKKICFGSAHSRYS